MDEAGEDEIELRVDRLAAGGEGVGRAPSGLAVFVPLSAPGDLVRARVVLRRKRHARAEIVELLEPGPDRTAPRCAVFGRCGGCAWQHVRYAAQLEAKSSMLGDALRRIGGHDLADPEIAPSPDAYGYRSRARVLVQGGEVGYRARRSHAIVATRACPVLAPALEAELAALAERASKAGGVEDGEWEIALGSDARTRAHPLDAPPDASAPDGFAMEVAGDRLDVSPGAFAQANGLLVEALHTHVCDAAGAGKELLELHAGGGLFTVALARRFTRVCAVEASAASAADLRRNLARAGLENVSVHAVRVESALPRGLGAGAEVVLLDPPRTGVPRAVADAVTARAPRRVVYVSCDPATLARDTARMADAGYRLATVAGFDLFPQTPHVEAVATLERV